MTDIEPEPTEGRRPKLVFRQSQFSPFGRLPRRRFFVLAGLTLLAEAALSASPFAGGAVAVGLCAMPFMIRRMHDAGRTGWWLAIWLAAEMALLFWWVGATLFDTAINRTTSFPTDARLIGGMLGLQALCFAAVGALRPQPDANCFGPATSADGWAAPFR
jgi:uncharacterized membrane protein YhaH (DUF805 family)